LILLWLECDADGVSEISLETVALARSLSAAGGGIAIRLLRNAILTATVGVAQSKARVYVSSGWSW